MLRCLCCFLFPLLLPVAPMACGCVRVGVSARTGDAVGAAAGDGGAGRWRRHVIPTGVPGSPLFPSAARDRDATPLPTLPHPWARRVAVARRPPPAAPAPAGWQRDADRSPTSSRHPTPPPRPPPRYHGRPKEAAHARLAHPRVWGCTARGGRSWPLWLRPAARHRQWPPPPRPRQPLHPRPTPPVHSGRRHLGHHPTPYTRSVCGLSGGSSGEGGCSRRRRAVPLLPVLCIH